MSKQTINLMIAGILIIHFLTGEAFEYDDIPEYYESLSESADILDDNVQDMQGEARQILLNPKRRRERRKQRIAALIEITGLQSCLFNHDKCENLGYNENKSPLKNNGTLNIWHCNCEMDFYDCLHRINSSISNKLGDLHFTLHTLCYRNDHKISDCIKYEYDKYFKQRRCIQYLTSLKTPIQTRLFDSPLYNGKPIQTSIYTVKDPRAK